MRVRSNGSTKINGSFPASNTLAYILTTNHHHRSLLTFSSHGNTSKYPWFFPLLQALYIIRTWQLNLLAHLFVTCSPFHHTFISPSVVFSFRAFHNLCFSAHILSMPHRSILPFSHPTSANSFLVIIPHSLLFNLFTFCHEQEPSAFSWSDATTYFFDLTERDHRLVQPARRPQPTWKPNFWYLLDRCNFHFECNVKSLYSHNKNYSQFVLHLFSHWEKSPIQWIINS